MFRGEKSGFIGRQEYIDRAIKKCLKTPGSIESIVGPGGSGKSQLAFKSMCKYCEKEIRNALCEKEHPLIFIDNFETVSLAINHSKPQEVSEIEDARQIKDFLNNSIPENTSLFLTSRERNNLGGKEIRIDLKGLNAHESKELFSELVTDEYLKNPSSENVQKIIENLLQKVGGHPLSIEIMAKNITTVEEIEEVSKKLGDAVNRDESNKHLQSLKASFEYTISKLYTNLKELLHKLTFFNSSFPIAAAGEIFGATTADISNLYNRSLLSRVESDDAFGKIKEPEYFLYKFHPATRGYLQHEIAKKIVGGNFYRRMEKEYGEGFTDFYYHLLDDTFNSIAKEDEKVPDKIRRFNIIFGIENNDFERTLILTKRPDLKAKISTLVDSILPLM